MSLTKMERIDPKEIPCAWVVGTTDYTSTLQKKSSSDPETDSTKDSDSNFKDSTVPTAEKKGKKTNNTDNDTSKVSQQQTFPSELKKNEIDTFKHSLYQNRLSSQPSAAVESILGTTCEAIEFDIAEVWLRTGPKTHQLISSHLRPSALENSVRSDLVDVYYGERSSERTHRLSPALCKRAKESRDVVWVTANTEQDAEQLRSSISDVRTAVAIPLCHESSFTNVTYIYFSMRRATMHSTVVEFLVHMSLSAAVASANPFLDYIHEKKNLKKFQMTSNDYSNQGVADSAAYKQISKYNEGKTHYLIRNQSGSLSVTGAKLDLKWSVLQNVEYLTDGGNSWIHTAVMNSRPVVIKTLKPECQDIVLAINEIEAELAIHSKLNHPNIVSLCGAGLTSKGVRFVVLERLDGGTLTQVLGYDTRIRDRRRRFWKRRLWSYIESLTHARNIADAMSYCHEKAIPGCICLHRDLKPDNIGFTLDGTVKILDFGLARIVENALPSSDDVYQMSGETGSLRYMAPEVADLRPYNHKADVYSYGIILWELLIHKRPFDGMTRTSFYERVVRRHERPIVPKRWPQDLTSLIERCWSPDIRTRPNFSEIVDSLNNMIGAEKRVGIKKKVRGNLLSPIDRHSTWF